MTSTDTRDDLRPGPQAAELAVLAEAGWPPPGQPEAVLAPVGRFVESSFPLLVVALAERCLLRCYGAPAPPPAQGRRTGLVLVTERADTAATRAVERAVAADTPVDKPLLFQTVPTAALGHVAARWGLVGPMVSLAPIDDPLGDGLEAAALLIRDGAADQVLLIVADQAHDDRPDTGRALLLARGPGAAVPTVGSEPFKRESHRYLAQLREAGPIQPVRFVEGLDGWLVVDHDLAREVLTHPGVQRDITPVRHALAAAGNTSYEPGEKGLGGGFFGADGSDHAQMRKTIARALSPKRMRTLAPRVREVAEELLAAVSPLGRADLVASFTRPLTTTVLAEVLGVPEHLREGLRAQGVVALEGPSERQRQAVVDFKRDVAELLAAKRRDPAEDLFSLMVAERDADPDVLSEDDLCANAGSLLMAGNDTPSNFLANSIIALIEHPEQLRTLRGSSELPPEAIEELLRYDHPLDYLPLRFATADLELGGQLIRAGSAISVSPAAIGRACPVTGSGTHAANTLDLGRRDAPHLPFGHGIHYCLAAPLSQLQAAIGLGMLFECLPDLILETPVDELPWHTSGFLHGPHSLPVRFTAGRR